MHIRMVYIFTLVFCLATSGCTALNSFDKGSKEDIERSKASIAHLNEQIAALNKEVKTLKTELQQIKEDEQEEAGEDSLNNQTDAVKEETIKKALDAKRVSLKKEATIKPLKIKVLSGNGKLSVARGMSKKLTGMGYKIEDIGVASRKDFKTNTIYFAAEYQKEAESLSAKLGDTATSKPMTWPSVFHIIVVAVP